MFSLQDVPEGSKRDIAFQMIVAMRDTLNIAKKRGNKPTYENAIRLFHDFSPELYQDIIGAIPQRNISDEAKVYIAKADAMSPKGTRKVDPLSILQIEIDELKDLLKTNKELDGEKKKTLVNKLLSLETIKKSLKPRALTENRILNRDATKVNRADFGAVYIGNDDFYVDYDLTHGKYLRIRLLHPDEAEHITGADLVYEQHNEQTKQIRILFLQYKIWEDGVIYYSKAKNLEAQLRKLETVLCKNKCCDSYEIPVGENDYRFPYCSAFFRPTDKLQEQNEKLISSGLHIPICKVLQDRDAGEIKIEKKQSRYQTLNHEIFEHLFNRGFLGSRWMSEEEVDTLYKKYEILKSDDSVVFYAREILTKS